MLIVHFILHIEEHLRTFCLNHGTWIYVLLFLIIFCETGLVILPFLPGDSLLFAVGALASTGLIDIYTVLWSLIIAAILGDSINYILGAWVGPRVFHQEKGLWFRKEYLHRAHAFYEKYGAKAIVLARFVPIIRTFAPFVAGIGTMNYRRFLLYNVVGAVAWIGVFLLGGYFLGNIPYVKSNFKLLLLLIIIGSLMPIIWEWWQVSGKKKLSFSRD